MASRKSQILTKIVSILETLIPADIKTVNYQVIKIADGDFEEWELPAIQLIDQGEIVEHEQGRARKTWDIVLEILLKTTVAGQVNQQTMFDLQNLVERKLWENPQIGIPGVIDLKYNGSATDLHLLSPLYYCRMDFTVRYYDALVSDC